MKVLGVSGSPIPNSNTDRAVKFALEATGLDTEFLKLSDYSIAPCKACLGCLKTNRCVIEDDGIMLAEIAKEADALVIGCYTSYSSIDARTKSFIERLYPLRHINGFMRGKPGGAIVTCAVPDNAEGLPPAFDMGKNAIIFYMMEEGMSFEGAVKVKGNVPCVKCGHGDLCDMSGIKMLYGADATAASIGVNVFETQPDAMAEAAELGKKIARNLLGKQ
ncbi:MAG: flavodoxin family protein [Thermodesulfovibrio sp.]|nr:flavodoxin family protein [Thermodesulfovibrio sp.]